MLSSWVFYPTHIHQGNISSLVGKIVFNKCCLYLETIFMSRAAIFKIKISYNLYGLQQSYVI